MEVGFSSVVRCCFYLSLTRCNKQQNSNDATVSLDFSGYDVYLPPLFSSGSDFINAYFPDIICLRSLRFVSGKCLSSFVFPPVRCNRHFLCFIALACGKEESRAKKRGVTSAKCCAQSIHDMAIRHIPLHTPLSLAIIHNNAQLLAILHPPPVPRRQRMFEKMKRQRKRSVEKSGKEMKHDDHFRRSGCRWNLRVD